MTSTPRSRWPTLMAVRATEYATVGVVGDGRRLHARILQKK